MRRVVAAVAVAALVAAAPVWGMDMPGGGLATPAGEGQSAHVSIGFGDYEPAQIDVLAGDTVSWTNESERNHTVTDDGGAFDSGVLASGDGFAHRFASPGTFTYHCRLHPYIRGEVEAWTLLLTRPTAAAAPSKPFPLQGRADLPANTAVTIEADSGSGYRDVATATVQPDGTFTAVVTPSGTANYRAVADDQSSPAVPLLVLNHTISARARRGLGAHASETARGRDAAVVTVHVTPADPGGTVVLQLHLRERFGWWPVAQARLDRSSRARFVVHLRRDVSARALLTLPDGATPLATTPLLRVGPRRHGR